MPNLGQKGIAHILLLLLLVLGIGLGVYLIGQKTQLFPWAASNPVEPCSISAPCPSVTPSLNPSGTASFLLSAPTIVTPNSGFTLKLRMKSPTEAANTFSAQLTFDPSKLGVESITMDSTIGSFITQADDIFFDNSTGEISLLGGLPDPGIRTISTQGDVMAEINFQAKGLGQTIIKLKSGSQIISNETSQNIDSGNLPDAVVNIISAPSPTPTPSIAPSVTPVPTPTPSPSPSLPPVACTLTNAKWVYFQNPMTQGNTAVARVDGSGGCVGKKISFVVKEDDGVLGSQSVTNNNPTDATFNADNFVTSAWIAEFQQDGINGINNPPEYFFTATLVDNPQVSISSSTSDELKVNNLRAGEFINGDGNRDGKVDILDLAVLRKWWGKTGFPQEIDIDDNGVLNTFDLAGLRKILEISGIIRTRTN